jgi:hypothetical protein
MRAAPECRFGENQCGRSREGTGVTTIALGLLAGPAVVVPQAAMSTGVDPFLPQVRDGGRQVLRSSNAAAVQLSCGVPQQGHQFQAPWTPTGHGFCRARGSFYGEDINGRFLGHRVRDCREPT